MYNDVVKKINNNQLIIQKISAIDANEIFKIALIENLSAYSNTVMSAILKYGYSRMAKEFKVSASAVHKWFKNSNIPNSRLNSVAEKLNLTKDDFGLVVDKDIWGLISNGE